MKLFTLLFAFLFLFLFLTAFASPKGPTTKQTICLISILTLGLFATDYFAASIETKQNQFRNERPSTQPVEKK